jgi:hypothetical protein
LEVVNCRFVENFFISRLLDHRRCRRRRCLQRSLAHYACDGRPPFEWRSASWGNVAALVVHAAIVASIAAGVRRLFLEIGPSNGRLRPLLAIPAPRDRIGAGRQPIFGSAVCLYGGASYDRAVIEQPLALTFVSRRPE